MGSRVLDSLYVSGYGAAAASGTVQFYQPGTLTPVTVYSDDGLTQALSQPITLDATGKTPLPVYTAAPLRAIIKSQAGATLQDITRIDGDRAELVQVSNASWPGATTADAVFTAIGTSLGGTNGQYLAPGTGAVARNLQTVIADLAFDVKNYGAVGNGIVDDTSAIQSAVTACVAAGGGCVLFPPGTYLISSALSVSPSSAMGISFVGAGIGASVLTGTAAAQHAISTGGSFLTALTLSGLSILHATNSTGAALNLGTSATVAVSLVNVSTGVSTGATGYRYSVLRSAGLNTISIASSTLQTYVTDANSRNISLGGTAFLSVVGSTLQQSNGDIAHSGAGSVFVVGSGLNSSAGTSISISGTASLYEAGNFFGGATAVSLGSSAGFSQVTSVSAFAMADSRTGAPVNYSLGTSSAVTPLPLETPSVRIVATAAITVTVGPISATGFGRQWSLICSNASGGAVTWTFDAQYKLSGAVAPATGNRVNLILEFNPIDGKVYEVGRAATAN